MTRVRVKSVSTLLVRLHKIEDDIIERIREDGINPSEKVRELIRNYGEEKYPPVPVYAAAQLERVELKKEELAKKKAFDEMPPEVYVREKLRGKIVMQEGRKVAVFRVVNGDSVYFDLDTIKEKNAENTWQIGLHNDLMDRKAKFLGTTPLTDYDYTAALKGWEEIVSL